MLKSRNASLGFIFATILIDCIGFGIIIPIIPKLIEKLNGGNIAEASLVGGWLLTLYAIMQFLFSPVLGGLSDRFGRRPVLLTSLLGLGLDYFLLAFAPNIAWLVVGRIIAGIGGASFTTASAYIADVSPPEKRAQNFGLIGVAFGLGFIIGPLLGALFSKIDLRAPFVAAGVLSLLNFLYGFFFIPESLSQENRRPFDWKRANPLGTFYNLRRNPQIIGLIVGLLILYIAGKTIETIWGYYNILKFDWSEAEIGYSLAFVGVLVSAVQGGLIRWFIPKFGQIKSIFYGIFFYAIGLALFSIATKSWMMYAALIPYCLGGLCGPAIQGLISNQIPNNEQGEIQGVFTALMSISAIVSPFIMTNLFYQFSRPDADLFFPGISFALSAVLCMLGAAVIYWSVKTHKFKQH
ncbi:MAG: TCR/Tet family transporter [Bacteroidetes bacterium]|jgi:DHA1 family tetracycline resistance protein-like MFS transporter|nr:TCR/Tet family transporter [Bacteroidota bacterium]